MADINYKFYVDVDGEVRIVVEGSESESTTTINSETEIPELQQTIDDQSGKVVLPEHSIDNHDDVDITSNPPSNGQALVWNDAINKFEPQDQTGTGGGVTDHGNLSGLSDDDHPQYHTDARGDVRYYQKNEVDGIVSNVQSNLDTHEGDFNNPHQVTITQTISQDANTDITTGELETLSNQSNADTLHSHSLIQSPDTLSCVETQNSLVQIKVADEPMVEVTSNGNVNLPFGNQKITNLATPTSDLDAANKKYVDDEIDIHEQTIDNHGDVDVSTTAPVNTNILRFDGTNWIPSREKQFTSISGRFEIDNDDDWACWSDPNFGPNLQDWDLDLGNNATPNIDWDGMGMLFPAGATLNRIVVKVRGSSNDIDSIQTFARVHDVDLFAGNPIDSNGEIGAFDIPEANLTIDLDAGAGDANDVRGFEIPLGDYTFTNAGDLHLMMRSVPGSTTGNRQLRCTLFIEWELPL